MTFPQPFFSPVVAAGVTPVDIAFVPGSDLKDTSNQTTYNFADVPFGAADAGRWLVVHIHGANNDRTVNSVTIGGVSASRVTDGVNDAETVVSDPASVVGALWIANVPTGTSGTVSITWSGGQARTAIALFRMTGNSGAQASQVATDTGTSGTDLSASLTIPSNGGGIGGVGVNTPDSPRTFTWTNLTEQYDEEVGEGNNSYSGALSLASGTATRTATASGSFVQGVLVLAAWGP